MQTLLPPTVERTLRQVILPDLVNKGRPNYDKPHTEAVVHWTKRLVQELSTDAAPLDPLVLCTAAYAHDWGYAGLFPAGESSYTFDEVLARKKQHLLDGANRIEQLLYNRLLSHFTEAQRQRVIHLVRYHDALDILNDPDEILLMEADTLGMIDQKRVPQTLPKNQQTVFLKGVRSSRLPRFTHQIALEYAESLLEAYEANGK